MRSQVPVPDPHWKPLHVFTTRNQQHSCGRWSLDTHFVGRPEARAPFDALLLAVERIGSVTVVSSKSRITLMTRMRFVAVTPRSRHLRAHVVLDAEVASSRVLRVERIGSSFVHHFELRSVADLDDDLIALLRHGYAVGNQERLIPE